MGLSIYSLAYGYNVIHELFTKNAIISFSYNYNFQTVFYEYRMSYHQKYQNIHTTLGILNEIKFPV